VDRQADYSLAEQEMAIDDGYAVRFVMKDGSSFIWTNDEESADSCCTWLNSGRICVPMKDVASIKQGSCPEHAEVVPGKPAEERRTRKAEQDWKATQAENERLRKAWSAEGWMNEALKLLRRDPAAYKADYEEYRRSCSGVKGAPAP
jgi:hypothetical protein